MTPRDLNVNATNGLVLGHLRDVAPTNHVGAALVVHAGATAAGYTFKLFTCIRIGVVPATSLTLTAVADFQTEVRTEIDTSSTTSIWWLNKKLAIGLIVLGSRFAEYFGWGYLLVGMHWGMRRLHRAPPFPSASHSPPRLQGCRLVETAALGFACLGSRRFERTGLSASLVASFALGHHSIPQALHIVLWRYNYRPVTGLNRFGSRPCCLPLRLILFGLWIHNRSAGSCHRRMRPPEYARCVALLTVELPGSQRLGPTPVSTQTWPNAAILRRNTPHEIAIGKRLFHLEGDLYKSTECRRVMFECIAWSVPYSFIFGQLCTKTRGGPKYKCESMKSPARVTVRPRAGPRSGSG